MARPRTVDQSTPEFSTVVDDDQYDELSSLESIPIVYVSIWDDAIVDAIEPEQTGATAIDLDLYLRDGVYFELFGVVSYPHPEADPIDDMDTVRRLLHECVAQGALLHEVAVDEEDGLVLVVAHGGAPVLYLQVGAWILGEWQELPEDVAS